MVKALIQIFLILTLLQISLGGAVCPSKYVSINNLCKLNDIEEPKHMTQIEGNTKLYWEIKSDDSIDFLLYYEKKCFFALGFGSTMTNLDLVVIELKNGEVVVGDYFAVTHGLPSYDEHQDFDTLGYQIGEDFVKAKFNRKIRSSDQFDTSFLTNEQMTWAFAFNPSSPTLQKHTSKGTFTMNFKESQSVLLSISLIVIGIIFSVIF